MADEMKQELNFEDLEKVGGGVAMFEHLKEADGYKKAVDGDDETSKRKATIVVDGRRVL